MDSKKTWDLAAVASIPLTMTLANSMLIPILPLMRKNLHITSMQTSLIITVYAAIAILCIPIAGYLSDRFGRKKVIVPSLLLAAVGGLISGLAAWLIKDGQLAFWMILIGRFVQGIGAAGAFPIAIPLVGDMFQSEEKISSGLGIVETTNTFGKVLSPVIGSALAVGVWYMPLLAIPFLCLISLLAVVFLVKTPFRDEQEKPQNLRSFLHSMGKVFRTGGGWLYAIFAIGGIGMFALFGFLFYLSEILEEVYHTKGIMKGLWLAVPLTAVCLSSLITGKMVGQRKALMKWLTAAGMGLLSLALLVCGLLDTKSKLLLLSMMFVSGIGIGIALPCLDALITEGIEKKQRGTITSLYSSMRFIGVAAGPIVTAMLLQQERLLFYSCSVVAAAACFLTLFAIRPSRIQLSQANH